MLDTPSHILKKILYYFSPNPWPTGAKMAAKTSLRVGLTRAVLQVGEEALRPLPRHLSALGARCHSDHPSTRSVPGEPLSCLLETSSPFRRPDETTPGSVPAHCWVTCAASEGLHFTSHNIPHWRREPACVTACYEPSPHGNWLDSLLTRASEASGRSLWGNPQADPARTPHWESCC